MVRPWPVCSAAVSINAPQYFSHLLIQLAVKVIFNDVYAPCETAQSLNLENYLYDGVALMQQAQ